VAAAAAAPVAVVGRKSIRLPLMRSPLCFSPDKAANNLLELEEEEEVELEAEASRQRVKRPQPPPLVGDDRASTCWERVTEAGAEE
jgi:hypothetical protein